MSNTEIKKFFDKLYKKYNTAEYIPTDPIYFPHSYQGNKEFIAFTSAMFAYGNVKAMQKFLSAFFNSCGTDPFKLKDNPEKLKYRFQSADDVAGYCKVMKEIYIKHENLEAYFLSFGNDLRQASSGAFEDIRKRLGECTQGLAFLFPIPGKSASKRLNMFLRWMIRSDDVDLGLWKHFKAEVLSMPVDTHIQRFAEKYGIISGKDKGMKALVKIDGFFKELSPEDPAKYDFSMTRLGIAKGCKYSECDACNTCSDRLICVFN